MELIKLKELQAGPTPLGGTARQIVANPYLRLVHLTVEAGQAVQPHNAEVDVVFYVISGCGRILLDEGTIKVSEGDIAVCPAGTKRMIEADADHNLCLLVIRSPNL